MQHEYRITGMTCDGCLAKVRRVISELEEVKKVEMQLDYPQAIIHSDKPIKPERVSAALKAAGNYMIADGDNAVRSVATFPEIVKDKSLPRKSWVTYKPLLLIVGLLVLVTALAQFPLYEFSFHLWMRHFMAGFFIVFSFFKLLNIRGFASSYAMYDLLAARWFGWGYFYPFLELALGLSYLINVNPVVTNWVTVVVLGFSSLGVIKSNLDKRQIRCACLGDVFNLPMSTVTIVEDLAMVVMAGWMLAGQNFITF